MGYGGGGPAAAGAAAAAAPSFTEVLVGLHRSILVIVGQGRDGLRNMPVEAALGCGRCGGAAMCDPEDALQLVGRRGRRWPHRSQC